MSDAPYRCEGKVRGSGGWRTLQCPCAASTEVNGKHYCKTHNPVLSAAKQKARDNAWRTKWDAEQKAREEARELRAVWHARAELCIAFCAGMTNEELKNAKT